MREIKRIIKKCIPDPLVNVLKRIRRKSRLVLSIHHETVVNYYKKFGKKIISSRPIICDPNSEYEIHVLICEKDFVNLIWTLKTFYYYSGLKTRLIIHDDGTLNSEAVRDLKTNFVNCNIIMKNDADIKIKILLKDHEFCYKYRFNKSAILSIKLFDYVFYSQTKKILFLDSDVLFFKKPITIIESMTSNKNFFLSDVADCYYSSREELQTLFGFEIERRVNAGLMYLNAEGLYDLALVDSFLRSVYEKPLTSSLGWVEQTAWAVMIAKNRHLFLRLPDSYQIAQKPITAKTISHHFVNDGYSRVNFYTKGLRYLKSVKFLQKFAMAL